MSKLNCMDGLTREEELEARELLTALKARKGSKGALEERLDNITKDFIRFAVPVYYCYIEEHDKVLYSALERAGGIEKLPDYLEKFEII